MTTRVRISTTKRVALFQREGGRCHICGGLVTAGEAWDVSHEIPLALGGADDETNWKVAHRVCHRELTSKTDIPAIAKAKRVEAIHLGAKPKGKGWPSRRKEQRETPKADWLRAMRERQHEEQQ